MAGKYEEFSRESLALFVSRYAGAEEDRGGAVAVEVKRCK